jgi:hypothetical protein
VNTFGRVYTGRRREMYDALATMLAELQEDETLAEVRKALDE